MYTHVKKKCVLNVNAGPNPTPTDKSGKYNVKTTQTEFGQKWWY